MLAKDSAANPPLPPIVEAMKRSSFYPERPAKVELMQTHISYVFLAGEHVYKLKKAVRFSFLDCTDITQRRHFCLEEIRLNRRLAPDVYLGMYPIVRAGNDFVLGHQSGEHSHALDYVVKMRRLPAERMLDRMLSRGEVDRATIQALAALIVNFHRAASPARASRYGSAAEVWRRIVGDIIDMERLAPGAVAAEQLAVIEKHCRDFITSHWQQLNARAEAGHVREGHGDLRCEHICIEGDKISIFDCVEFSERLRTCDLASEVAFLAMDLDRLGAPELADELVGEAARLAHDDDLPLLMPLYKCYRASIRGMVESLRSRQSQIDDRERKSSMHLAGQYFSLACSYATEAAPAIAVVCGLSGTGKSTLARALNHRFGFPIISSDRIRKKLASIPAERSAADSYKVGIYSDANTESTYAAIIDEAGRAIKDGSGVILDATFLDPAHRKAALDLAARAAVPILFIECRADDKEIRRRLTERQQRGHDPSDATVAVYQRQCEDLVALSEIPSSHHLIADTTGPLSQIVADARLSLARISLKTLDH
jgi:uncharacterized protein